MYDETYLVENKENFARTFTILDADVSGRDKSVSGEPVHWVIAMSCLETGEHREADTGRVISTKELTMKSQMSVSSYAKVVAEQRALFGKEIGQKEMPLWTTTFTQNPAFQEA